MPEREALETIKAMPGHLIYDGTNGYRVVSYTNLDTKDSFVGAGRNIPDSYGECILTGYFSVHKKYGKQFIVEQSQEVLPDEPQKMVEYLVFAKIKGLGRKMAERIVAKYGENTYAAMESEEMLEKIHGISAKKAAEFSRLFKEKLEMKNYYQYMKELGLPVSYAGVIYEKFSEEENGFELVQKRPYLMCICEGVDFLKVDQAVKCLPSFSGYRSDRIRFGIYYALERSESMGNVFCFPQRLLEDVQKILQIYENPEWIKHMINTMIKEKDLVYSYKGIYREVMYDAETFVAERICRWVRYPKEQIDTEKLNEIIKELEQSEGKCLEKSQKNSVFNSFFYPVSIVTGGPGCGKTFTINFIIRAFRKMYPEKRVVLCAPTGRAARRLSESTGMPAQTIHSLLGLHKDEFHHDIEAVDADLVIADEFSMCSMTLSASFFSALNPETKLILSGDQDQLPSVQAGNVFSDLVGCRMIPTTVLDVVFRQAEGSSITANSRLINKNTLLGGKPLYTDESFRWILSYTEEDCLKKVLYTVKTALTVSKPEDVIVLTPFRTKTLLGDESLNHYLQDIFNPQAFGKAEMKNGKRVFRIGDRVIHLKNETAVNNGDMGNIISISQDSLTVRFETGEERSYERSEFNLLKHAYALTIHKSQGSEYKKVILPFIPAFGRMRKRNLLYTAITRAKKEVTLVGDPESIRVAAATPGNHRNTYLGYRIMIGCKEENTFQQMSFQFSTHSGS